MKEHNNYPVRGYTIYEHRRGLHYEINLDENNAYYDSFKGGAMEGKSVVFETDENGFIAPSEVHDNPELKMVFCGDSTVECTYVTPEKRYPYMVGRLFENATAQKTNSYNAGVSGADTLSLTKVVLHKVLPLYPDILLFCNVKSELLFLLSKEENINVGVANKNTIVCTDNIYDYPMNKRLKMIVKLLCKDRIHKPHFLRKKSVACDEPEMLVCEKKCKLSIEEEQTLLSEFKRRLQTLISISNNCGIKLVLMTQANRYYSDEANVREYYVCHEECDLTYDSWIDVFQKANEIIRTICREKDVDLIDLDKHIEANAEYLYDCVHYTDRGSERAAEIICEEVRGIYEKICNGNTEQSI